MYCELCGEKFNYQLRRIPVKFPRGSIVSLLACELCDMEFNADRITDVARSLRIAVVQQQYDLGNLTEGQAHELLSGPLTPGDDTTIVDDSDQLVVGSENGQ